MTTTARRTDATMSIYLFIGARTPGRVGRHKRSEWRRSNLQLVSEHSQKKTHTHATHTHTHPRTHPRTHARTHARAHTHTRERERETDTGPRSTSKVVSACAPSLQETNLTGANKRPSVARSPPGCDEPEPSWHPTQPGRSGAPKARVRGALSVRNASHQSVEQCEASTAQVRGVARYVRGIRRTAPGRVPAKVV